MTKRIIYAFDWDYTLIDSHRKGLQCMCKTLAALNLFFNENSINKIYSPDYHEMYKKLNIPEERWEELDNLWLKYYLNEDKAHLFPEVRSPYRIVNKRMYSCLDHHRARSRVHGTEKSKLDPLFSHDHLPRRRPQCKTSAGCH